MSINRFIFSITIICTLLSGCGGGEELKVSVEGDGLVTSSPDGIRCGLGNTQCSTKFSTSPVVLTAAPPEDGSSSFFRWGGDCSGDVPTCTLNKASVVTAEFISADVANNLPTKPADLRVSAMGSSFFLIQWKASQDSATPREKLIYKVFASIDEARLLDDTSLIEVINGSQEERYSYDLDVEGLGLFADGAGYYVAIIALDADGYESKAATASNLELITEELQLRPGIVLQTANELGLPAPTIIASEDDEEYIYTNIPITVMPSVGDYIAQLVKEDGVEYHELLKVVTLTNDGFTAVAVPLIEVTATPYTISGSAEIGVVEQVDSIGTSSIQAAPTVPSSEVKSKNLGEGVSIPQSRDPEESLGVLGALSTSACSAPENLAKVSVSADAGMKKSLHYRIKVFTEILCSEPDLCNASENFIRFSADVNGRSRATINLSGGECYRSEIIKDLTDDNLLNAKLLGKLKFKGAKFRVSSGVRYLLQGMANSNVEMGDLYSIDQLGFTVDVRSAGASFKMKDPIIKVQPVMELNGDLDYSLEVGPFLKIDIDFKVVGLEYEGKLSSVVTGKTLVKSLSELNPQEVYVDTYDMTLGSTYVHSLSPNALLVSIDAFKDLLAYESEKIPLFGLPESAGDAKAESYQDDKMCRITYRYKDGANNALKAIPFNHYLLFEDSSEISLGTPVSTKRTDAVTEFTYEFTQEDLYKKYVSVTKEKRYKRIAAGESIIGETVVDNTDWAKK